MQFTPVSQWQHMLTEAVQTYVAARYPSLGYGPPVGAALPASAGSWPLALSLPHASFSQSLGLVAAGAAPFIGRHAFRAIGM